MAHFIDKLAAANGLLSFIGQNAPVYFFAEHDLADKRRSLPRRSGTPFLPGKKKGPNSAVYGKNAYVLGILAREKVPDGNFIVVYFRDNDGASSNDKKATYSSKISAMQQGFDKAECYTGVPMVPRPKSEAWILCALTKNYQNCASLEERSGNDDSPNSLKKELKDVFRDRYKQEVNAETLNEHVANNDIDPVRISMPSYDAFRLAFDKACEIICNRSES